MFDLIKKLSFVLGILCIFILIGFIVAAFSESDPSYIIYILFALVFAVVLFGIAVKKDPSVSSSINSRTSLNRDFKFFINILLAILFAVILFGIFFYFIHL